MHFHGLCLPQTPAHGRRLKDPAEMPVGCHAHYLVNNICSLHFGDSKRSSPVSTSLPYESFTTPPGGGSPRVSAKTVLVASASLELRSARA